MAFQDTGLKVPGSKRRALWRCRVTTRYSLNCRSKSRRSSPRLKATRNIPGGIVAVIEGTCGSPSEVPSCIIKAELTAALPSARPMVISHLRVHQGTIPDAAGQALQDRCIPFATIQVCYPKTPCRLEGDFLFDDPSPRATSSLQHWYFYETFLRVGVPVQQRFPEQTISMR